MVAVAQAFEDMSEHLTEEQQQRAAALAFARVVLIIGVPAPQVVAPEMPYELVDLAKYIVSGPDESEDGDE